jgi:carbonic anhydrase
MKTTPQASAPNRNWHCRRRGDSPSSPAWTRVSIRPNMPAAHVIRNAGGRASDDAIRSLVISHKLLGTMEWFVVHHSDCGMLLFDDEIMSGLLEQSLETATIDEKGWHDHGHGPGSVHGHYVKWLTFKNLEASVADDVKRIRSHPLVPGYIPVYGYYYDVKTGRLVEVPEAMAAGKAKT